MAVKIRKRGSPLEGIANAAQVAAKVGILTDPTESYSDRRDAAGWLRGAWTVIKRDPKQKKAADYINDLLRTHRYSEDTTGD